MIFRNQNGAGFIGVMFWLITVLIGIVGVMKLLPAHMEYYTIQRVLNQTLSATTVDMSNHQILEDFRKRASIDNVGFVVESLEINKDSGRIEMSFQYDKEVELFGNVSMVIHFNGSARGS